MRYSCEFKKECVELYKQGKWMETPEGVNQRMFRDNIRYWSHLVDFHGEKILKHKGRDKKWSAEEKFKWVSKVLAGNSYMSVAIEAAFFLNNCLLYGIIKKSNWRLCINVIILKY